MNNPLFLKSGDRRVTGGQMVHPDHISHAVRPAQSSRLRYSCPPPPVTSCAGFTLIELLVVVAIIAILAGLTLSTLGYVNRKAARSRAEAEVAALSGAIDSFKLDFGSYPASNSLFAELTAQGTVNKKKVYFEPTPQIATNMVAGPFIDPWGANYCYETNPTKIVNIGFFDLWSTAGEPTPGGNSNNWIRN